MISRIRENFAQFIESMNIKKEEILKQNKFISLENLLSFYEENKKILLDKKENLLAILNKYFPNINLNINLKFNLDLSFLETVPARLFQLTPTPIPPWTIGFSI